MVGGKGVGVKKNLKADGKDAAKQIGPRDLRITSLWDFLTVTNSAFVDLENRGAHKCNVKVKKEAIREKVLCRKKSSLQVSFLVKLQD